MLLEFNKLTKKEISVFEDFVNSPYFNTYKTLRKLFYYLKSKHPGITEKDISSRYISMNIYKERKINHVKIRKLFSEYTRLFENFLMHTESDKSSIRNRIKLLKSLRLKEISGRFRIHLEKVCNDISKVQQDGYSYYDDLNALRYELLNFSVDSQPDLLTENLIKYSESTDNFFIYSKLRIFIQTFAINKFSGEKQIKNDTFYNEVISYIEKNKSYFTKNQPEIMSTYYFLMMNVSEDEKYVKEFTSYFNDNRNKFRGRMLYNYYIYIESYYRLRVSGDNYTASDEERTMLHDTYNLLFFKTGYFLKYTVESEEGIIPQFIFDCAVDNALMLGKINWAEEFTETYIKYTDPLIRKSLHNLCLAKIYFYEKKYSYALNRLAEISFTDEKFYRSSKMLYAMIYFESGDYRSMEHIIENLKSYVLIKKLPEQVKRKARLFNRYIGLLLKLNTKSYKNHRNSLQTTIRELEMNKNNLYYRKWITEKLKQLQRKKYGVS